MPIQDFNIYTANGYAGDLVDSAPRVIQTGILTTATGAGFGKAMSRDPSVERGTSLGDSGNIYAISQREYNHEASAIPAKAGDWAYKANESVSLIREGYLYVELDATSGAVVAGDLLATIPATGEFLSSGSTDATDTTNVVAEEAGIAGDVIKVRIDIQNA